jgi:two-component system, OmpR family, phosphate regulon sensor histidine kinase PhoR
MPGRGSTSSGFPRRVGWSRPLVLALCAVWMLTALAWGLELIGTSQGIRLSTLGVAAALASWVLLLRVQRVDDEWKRSLERIAVRLPESVRIADEGKDRPRNAADEMERLVTQLAAGVPALTEQISDLSVRGGNLQAIIDALDEPVIATNETGIVELANEAAGTFFARPIGTLVGMAFTDLFTQSSVLDLHAAAAAGTAGQAQARIARARAIGGTLRVYEISAAPTQLRAADATSFRRGVVVSLRDVTELATAIQLKTDFVANASHELRTPLAAIKAAVETISDSARDDPEMIERLAKMVMSNAERLEDLTRDLLDLSRLESPDAPVAREPVDMNRLAASLTAMFSQVCEERKLTLDFSFAPDLAAIESDPRLLDLILKNLIENATKFAYEGTEVRISGTPLDRATPDPRAGRGIRLRVGDKGIGIPLASQSRIFERFYQVDLSRAGVISKRGTGLGLAIVKHAVRALGGTISVESTWKQGTTMTVEIPGCLPAQAPAGHIATR